MANLTNIKEAFKKFDAYFDEKIIWENVNFSYVRNAPPMTTSEVDNMFGELVVDGEDRVFENSFYVNSHPRQPNNAVGTKAKKNFDDFNFEDMKIGKLLQIPIKHVVKKEIVEND